MQERLITKRQKKELQQLQLQLQDRDHLFTSKSRINGKYIDLWTIECMATFRLFIVCGLATFPGKIPQAASIVSAIIRMNLAISLKDDGASVVSSATEKGVSAKM